MTIRERIEAVLKGDLPDKVPLTIYWLMLPRGEKERLLRNKGLGISYRADVLRWEYPNCKIETKKYLKNGRQCSTTVWNTPVGQVYSTTVPEESYKTGEVIIERPFKKKDDYKALEFIAKDAQPVPIYDEFRRIEELVGNDGYVMTHLGYSPLMEMIIQIIGLDKFAFEMFDNADAFWSLYECLCKKMRKAYPLIAASPANLSLYCGNIHPKIISPKLFEQNILNCLNELAQHMHECSKLLGCHLDAGTEQFKKAIADSQIDVIEAFTPLPDCDMTVAQARQSWPNKIIWSNFPSSVHLADSDTIRQTTIDMLSQSSPGDKFIIGVTEDIPAEHWYRSLDIIADTINQYGVTPINK